jgi:hypothetical protein
MSGCRLKQSLSRRDVLGCSRTRKERLDNLEKKDRDVRKTPPQTFEENAKHQQAVFRKNEALSASLLKIYKKIPGILLDT